MDLKHKLAAAAELLHCEPEDFISYAERGENLAVIAPSGQKFVFSAERLENTANKPAKPKRPTPRRTRSAKGKTE